MVEQTAETDRPQQDAPRQARFERICAFLGDRGAHDGAPVEQIETHVSRLFLTPDRVFKLKKPVTYAFLDFAPLAARERACRREVEINRAFAPSLYLGLRPILERADGALSLGPLLTDPHAAADQAAAAPAPARIVDWVVEMRRFDRGGEFSRLAETGRLTRAHLNALADGIAAFHRAAPRPRAPAAPGRQRQEIQDLLRNLRRGPAARAATLWAAEALEQEAALRPFLLARARRGCPRRLHGDLHLGNICLIGGEPTPFDAIEFDEDLATIEPLKDLAFTAMDLLWRGGAAEAQALLSRYLAATRDYSGLRAWPLFLSVRAATRAMAAALTDDGEEAEARLRFATGLLGRPAPRLLAVGGLSGSGKSTLARALAPRLGPGAAAVSISSDTVRKRLFAKPPEARLPAAAYAPEIHDRVYRRLIIDAGRALKAGASVVLDAVLSRPEERAALTALASRLGVRFDGFWLAAPLEARLDRVAARAAAPTPDASDAGPAVAARQNGDLGPEETGWRRIDAGGGAQETLAQAAAALNLPDGPAPSLGPASDEFSKKEAHQ